MGPSVEECEAYLNKIGAGSVKHLGGNVFSEHLRGVEAVLERWGQPKEVCLAGLFHSIYGTEGFQDFALPFSRGRDEIRALIGPRAEHIAYVNCCMNRATLDALVMSPSSGEKKVEVRPDLGLPPLEPLTEQEFEDLLVVHVADWLEQVEREAGKPALNHGWPEAGWAWGYRRHAFKAMAERLGGPALAEYKEVYAREPEHTRHLHQPYTPPQQLFQHRAAAAA